MRSRRPEERGEWITEDDEGTSTFGSRGKIAQCADDKDAMFARVSSIEGLRAISTRQPLQKHWSQPQSSGTTGSAGTFSLDDEWAQWEQHAEVSLFVVSPSDEKTPRQRNGQRNSPNTSDNVTSVRNING